MNYFIKREIQEYGPYSLAELAALRGFRKYSADRPLPRRRNGAMGAGFAGHRQYGGAISSAGPCGCRGDAALTVSTATIPALGNRLAAGNTDVRTLWVRWMIVQALWVKKVQPSSKALLYLCLGFVLLIAAGILGAFPDENLQTLGVIPNIGGLVLSIVAWFSMKSSIEEHYIVAEPLGLTLSGIMTFFFNVYYFQYHFTRIIELKRSEGQIV